MVLSSDTYVRTHRDETGPAVGEKRAVSDEPSEVNPSAKRVHSEPSAELDASTPHAASYVATRFGDTHGRGGERKSRRGGRGAW